MMHEIANPLGNNAIVPHFDDELDGSLEIQLKRIEDHPTFLVLYLSGYIDTYNSNCFVKRVGLAIEAGFIRLIFNCRGTNFVSSCEIGCYTAFLKAIKPQGGDLSLIEMHPKVYEIYQSLGFSQFFNIMGSLEEAITFFITGRKESKTSAFPRIFKCPICGKKLEAIKSGRFRCSECRNMLKIDDAAGVIVE